MELLTIRVWDVENLQSETEQSFEAAGEDNHRPDEVHQ